MIIFHRDRYVESNSSTSKVFVNTLNITCSIILPSSSKPKWRPSSWEGTACSGGLGCKEEFSSGYSVFLGTRLGSQSDRQVFRVFSRLSTMKIMENINSRTRFITVKGNFSALYKRT